MNFQEMVNVVNEMVNGKAEVISTPEMQVIDLVMKDKVISVYRGSFPDSIGWNRTVKIDVYRDGNPVYGCLTNYKHLRTFVEKALKY